MDSLEKETLKPPLIHRVLDNTTIVVFFVAFGLAAYALNSLLGTPKPEPITIIDTGYMQIPIGKIAVSTFYSKQETFQPAESDHPASRQVDYVFRLGINIHANRLETQEIDDVGAE